MTSGKLAIAALLIVSTSAWAGVIPTTGSVKTANSVVHWGEDQFISTGISGVNFGGTMNMTCAKAAGCAILVQGVVTMTSQTADEGFTCVSVDGSEVPPLCLNTTAAGGGATTTVPVSGVASVAKGKHKIVFKAGGGTITGYNLSAQFLQ
jgi:hypothetical protein